MIILKVERIGGFPGFGVGHSHLRSTGEINMADLSEVDRQKVDELFKSPQPLEPTQTVHAFTYRLTRPTSTGIECIEAKEENVPNTIRLCVKDEII